MSTSVLRALKILELLSGSDKPLPLTRIAEQLDIPKSTAHAILRALASQEFLEVTEHASYSIGLRAFEVGAAHLRSNNAVDIVIPQLAYLTKELGITSHYAVLDGTDAVYLCKQDPPGLGIKLASSVGARLPAVVTAVGKAALAWLPGNDLAAHLPAGAEQRRDGGITAELAQVRERGYSLDDGATASGVRCIAAPVFSPSGAPGAIGVSYMLGSAVDAEAVAVHVMNSASRLTQLLGTLTRKATA